MKTTRSLGTVAAVVLLSALAACGGDDRGDDKPEDVISKVLLAGLDRDAKTVCANSVGNDGKVPDEEALKTCETQVKEAMDADEKTAKGLDAEAKKKRDSDEEAARKVFEGKPEKVSEETDGIVQVTYMFQGAEQVMSAKKIEGKWYFAG